MKSGNASRLLPRTEAMAAEGSGPVSRAVRNLLKQHPGWLERREAVRLPTRHQE